MVGKPGKNAAWLVALVLAGAPGCATQNATAAAADAGGDAAVSQCIGVKPAAAAWTAVPGPEGVTGVAAPVLGAAAPAFALTDFQPQSCGFGATYGLQAASGKVTVVALFAGWCSYCVAQSGKLEQMRLELQKAGYDLQFITVNKADAVANQEALVDQCAFALLQDTDAVNAYARLGANKDDFLIFGRDGRLFDYLPSDGQRITNLSVHEGYNTLHAAIVAAAASTP